MPRPIKPVSRFKIEATNIWVQNKTNIRLDVRMSSYEGELLLEIRRGKKPKNAKTN